MEAQPREGFQVPDANAGDGANAQGLSLIERIRADFHQCCGGGAFGALHDASRELDGDPHGTNIVTPQDLAVYFMSLAQKQCRFRGSCHLKAAEKEAIALRVAQMMHEMDISSRGIVRMEEWLHYMLLTRGGRGGKQVNSLLRRAMCKDMHVLQDLQKTFEHATRTSKGEMNIQEVLDLYCNRLSQLQPSGPPGAAPLSAEDFARDAIKFMNFKGDERISYPEFMAHCLGRTRCDVKLNIYDISAGRAKKFSPWLFGQRLDGLWHTGVVVFGREYYFSRDIFMQTPGETAFGAPTKVIHLGHTFWREEEFHQYISRQLKPRFHRGTYDCITNSCNHFTDCCTMYLVGCHVPNEVMQQPTWLLKSRFVQAARPLLNWHLRDRIAVREKGLDLPPGRPRLTPTDHLDAGTVVCVHSPTDDEGSIIVGLVADQNSAEALSVQTENLHSSGAPTSGSLCGSHLFTCSTAEPIECENSAPPGNSAAPPPNSVCVQYFDDVLFASGTVLSASPMRTEYVPCSRLSVANLADVASEAAYVLAMSAMGTPDRLVAIPHASQQHQRRHQSQKCEEVHSVIAPQAELLLPPWRRWKKSA